MTLMQRLTLMTWPAPSLKEKGCPRSRLLSNCTVRHSVTGLVKWQILGPLMNSQSGWAGAVSPVITVAARIMELFQAGLYLLAVGEGTRVVH